MSPPVLAPAECGALFADFLPYLHQDLREASVLGFHSSAFRYHERNFSRGFAFTKYVTLNVGNALRLTHISGTSELNTTNRQLLGSHGFYISKSFA